MYLQLTTAQCSQELLHSLCGKLRIYGLENELMHKAHVYHTSYEKVLIYDLEMSSILVRVECT